MKLVPVDSAQTIEWFKTLLTEYGNLRQHDAALGDYKTELATLPGVYTPPTGLALIAMNNNRPAGCVAYKQLTPTICEMKRLYVRPGQHGNGFGMALCKELIVQARKADYEAMRLDTHAWMNHAQSIYATLGFKETERYNNNPTPGIRFFELTL